jgi:AhpD family alkylhydroperoxidase
MKLDDRTLRLIAIGASITANCQPCLQNSMAQAREYGADEQEIAEAIAVGKTVRRGAASKMDECAARLRQTNPTAASPSTEGCGCDRQA